MNWAVQLMEQTLWISEHKKKADDRVDFFLNKVWEEPMGMTDSGHPASKICKGALPLSTSHALA